MTLISAWYLDNSSRGNFLPHFEGKLFIKPIFLVENSLRGQFFAETALCEDNFTRGQLILRQKFFARRDFLLNRTNHEPRHEQKLIKKIQRVV